MYGKNQVFKQVRESDYKGKVWIQEIFNTIQGEGPYQGRVATFVRFGGCNLRCGYCDTDFESSKNFPTVEETFRMIKDKLGLSHYWPDPRKAWTQRPLVVFTGGEPLAQPQALRFLVRSLIEGPNTVDVQIETSASLPCELVPLPKDSQALEYVKYRFRLHVVISPKTPKLNESFLENINGIPRSYKYVLQVRSISPEDGLPTNNPQPGDGRTPVARPTRTDDTVYVMPCDESPPLKDYMNDLNRQATVSAAIKHNYIFNLQLHKEIGMP